jgi:CDP-diacylglycerol---serine O-phosphatidyltransferase
MAKLPKPNQFTDFSDYGRPFGLWIALRLKSTKFTPVHVTYAFIIAGLVAIACLLTGKNITAAFFLIVKSILDAADGELSRVQQRPSYTGRYLDSIADWLLNFSFFTTIWWVSQGDWQLHLLAFGCVQLQGTLYNYYSVINRSKIVGGDATSQIFEQTAPQAFPYESQRVVNLLFRTYRVLYTFFDGVIYRLDASAAQINHFPKWFMTTVSIYGLGFQLFLMALFIAIGQLVWIAPFFIGFSGFLLLFMGIRKLHIR